MYKYIHAIYIPLLQMRCSYHGYLAARVLWAAGSSLYIKVHFSFIFGLITYLLVLWMTIKL